MRGFVTMFSDMPRSSTYNAGHIGVIDRAV